MAYKIGRTQPISPRHRRADTRQRAFESALRFSVGDHFNLGLDPEKARDFHDETCRRKAPSRALLLDVRPAFCSMKSRRSARVAGAGLNKTGATKGMEDKAQSS